MSAERPSNPAPDDGAAAAKVAARAAAVSARDSLDAAARTRASDEAAKRLLELPELAAAGVVMVYFALPKEINPLPAAIALRSRGVTIAYPRVESPGVLGVHEVGDERELVRGTFGLSQPADEAQPLDPERLDAIIVPGVAFDVSGARLGYGGGYYDRLLPLLRPDCVRVGLVFEEQILSEIPAEQHDAVVDLVVTQTRVIRPAGSRLG